MNFPLKFANKKSKMKTSLFLFISFLFFACGNNKPQKASTDLVNNPASADSSSIKSNGKAATISFENPSHDFGNITQGEILEYGFIFTNTGGSDLIISNASASCGCTIPDYPKEPIAPGKQGKIKVTFNSDGRIDRFLKEVNITSNTEPMTNTLYISGIILAKQTNKPNQSH